MAASLTNYKTTGHIAAMARHNVREQLLSAGLETLQRRGFNATSVEDITKAAGVPKGSFYNHFESKEALLDAVFRETWTDLLEAIQGVEASDGQAREQLRQVAAIMLRSWRRTPDLVRVLVQEIARSPDLHKRFDELGEAFDAIERIVARGQADGSFRADLDPRLASWIFYGALEEILTGWVLGRLRDGEEGVAQAERTVVEVIAGGLAARPVGTTA